MSRDVGGGEVRGPSKGVVPGPRGEEISSVQGLLEHWTRREFARRDRAVEPSLLLTRGTK